jgi:hypothetical protein
VLLQVPPPTKESEGVPIEKAKQQGMIASSKVAKQQWGRAKRYLKKVNNWV